jgi:hypothetical protein
VIADLVPSRRPRFRRPSRAGAPSLPDVHASLLAIRRLREDGLISDNEFVAKRVELLGRL